MITKQQLYDIAQGWARSFARELGLLSPEIAQMADKRLRICDTCEFRKGSICSKKVTGRNIITDMVTVGCGCNIKKKTLADRNACPAGKW